MSSEIFKAFVDVPKLQSDGSNYQIWSERAAIIAMGCGVGDYLSQVAPATKMTERNALRAAILNKVPDAIFLTVKAKKEPHEIMQALKSRFGMSTAIIQASSLERLYTLKCTDGKKIQSHLDELILIKDKLAEQGVTVTDDNFLSAIISSIPSGYKPVVIAYENSIRVHNSTATDDAQKKLDAYELINLLRVEAQSRAVTANTASSARPKKEESANSASPSQRGKGRGRGRSRGRGRGRGGNNGASSSGNSEVTCYRCGGKGHRSNQCATPRKEDHANAAQKGNNANATAKPAEAAAGAQVIIDEGWSAILSEDAPLTEMDLYDIIVEIGYRPETLKRKNGNKH